MRTQVRVDGPTRRGAVPPGGAGSPGRCGTGSTSVDAVRGAVRGAARLAARGLGPVLGVLVAGAARVRAGKPLHPQGLVLRGRLRRDAVGSPTGTWLDGPGEDDVVVRLSRGGGLPRRLPDVLGLALRVGDVDLLLSSPAGTGPGLRHVPGPRRGHGGAPYSSLLPFRGPEGPVLLLARPEPPRKLPHDRDGLARALAEQPLELRLSWATAGSRWRPLGTLEIMAEEARAVDRPVRFDPLRTPPGLGTYDWVAALRSPAYRAAQAHPARPDGAPHPGG
ncbi:hypothetical protein [Actinotalea ferrariae]|uniref:hypothetical protein n=1 Tax=Actinotalea ferrariae TaxID=1386098 RepID=UPI001C1DE8D3|nr:hypothetical protein [Actinotalea ferrariae]